VVEPTSTRIAELAKALGHPARVQIVELLSRQCECRGADVFSELPLAQSTVSEHLRVLREAGIVSASPEGTSTVYCLDPVALRELGEAMASFVLSANCCAERTCE